MSFAFAGADLLIEVDDGLTITFALGATKGLTATPDSHLPGKSLNLIVAESDQAYVATLLSGLKPASRCGPVLVRLAMAREDGSPRNALLNACRLPTSPDKINLTLGQVSLTGAMYAASRRRDANSQLLDEATFTTAAAQLAEAAHSLRKPLELTFLDLPELQKPDDLMSKDQAQALATRIGTLLRAASVDGSTAARLGPGRFGVVHDSTQTPDDLKSKVSEAATLPDGKTLQVNASSVEVARSELPPGTALRSIRYVVEQVAKNGVDPKKPTDLLEVFNAMVKTTLQRVRSFTDAVRDTQFTLVYQPIASLATGRYHHFEVLTRFKPDESPLNMIQFAEEVGIIERLDLAVATRMIDALRRPGLDRRTSFAINVSGNSLANPVFVKCLIDLLREHKPLAPRLAIEITESARLKNLEETNRILQDIRFEGFKVSLDDFGAGSASFQYLQALTVDFVKIDGAYVKRLGQSQRDDAMIKGLVRLCEDLNVGTIAEMVETREQVDMLRAIGVEMAQGYYFGKPMPEPSLPWDFSQQQMRFTSR
jgi:EAL domain-containing protein (putative c-di-GMP-specific phosphodiesterase class I)/GGDEF domain-containing protein